MNEIRADLVIQNILKILIALLILFAFIYILVPFIIPLSLGGILALACSSFINYFVNKGFGRKITLIVLTSSLFVLGFAPISFALIRGSKAINSLLTDQSLLSIKENIENKVYSILDNFSVLNNLDIVILRDKFDIFMTKAGNYAIVILSQLVTQIPDLILLGFISVLSFYFFLSNEAQIRKLFDRFFSFSPNNSDRFISLLKSSCREVFFSNVVTGFVQASIVAGGAFFCDIGDVYIIFICTFFLSFVPVFGAGPFSFCIAIYAFIEHRHSAGTAMVVVSLVSGVADNILRPYLTGLGEVEIHGFITFLAIIGGVFVMGLPGLFFGPLIALMTFGALPIILDDYLPGRKQN